MKFEERLRAWKHPQRSDVVWSVEARKLIKQSDKEDPDAFVSWLLARGEAVVADQLANANRHRRAATRRSAKAHAFAEATEQGVAPELENLYHVGEGTFRRLGDMTSDDCLAVADEFTADANGLLFEAALLRAVAAKVPAGKKVREVFSNGQVADMRDVLPEPERVEVAA